MSRSALLITGKTLSHRWLAGYVFLTNAMDSDICRCEVVFWVNKDGKRLENFAGFEMNEADRANARKIRIRSLDV